MTSDLNQYPNDVPNAEIDNGFLNSPESFHPYPFLPQNDPADRIESELSTQNFKCDDPTEPNPTVETNPDNYTNVASQSQKSRITRCDAIGSDFQMSLPGAASVGFTQFDDYFKSGTGAPWEGSFNFEGTPFPVARRADAWITAQEDHLMALRSKRPRKTLNEISFDMWMTFGVDRNPNVLSKRYRGILERNAKENVIAHCLNGALPIILECLQDELRKLKPDEVDKELLRAVCEELQRKWPKFVRSLNLGR